MIKWGRVVAVLVLVAALAAGVWKIYHSGVVGGRAEVQSRWNLAKLVQAEVDIKAEVDARAREQRLQADADTFRRTKDAKLRKVSADLLSALAANSLHRATRPPEHAAEPPGAGPVCTGARLFREDADFLVRESARADGLLAAFFNCEAQYNAARDALSQ